MCFSATVSFGASALLGTVGVASIKQAKTTPQKLFALTPIFFATQQFSEGLIWLSLQNSPINISPSFIPFLTVFFLIFAWLIWPTFIPYFMMRLETDNKRKGILKVILGIGIIVSIILLIILSTYNVNPRVDEQHIVFDREGYIPLTNVLGSFYFVALIFPFFMSSYRKMKMLGAVNILGFLIARFMFETYLISVWCFFAAISSILIFYLIKDMTNEKVILWSKSNHHIPSH